MGVALPGGRRASIARRGIWEIAVDSKPAEQAVLEFAPQVEARPVVKRVLKEYKPSFYHRLNSPQTPVSFRQWVLLEGIYTKRAGD